MVRFTYIWDYALVICFVRYRVNKKKYDFTVVRVGGNYISIRKSYHAIDKILGNLTWFNSAFHSISKQLLLGWDQLNSMAKLLVPPHYFSNIVMYIIDYYI